MPLGDFFRDFQEAAEDDQAAARERERMQRLRQRRHGR